MISNEATILVCCHKKDYWYAGEGFFPIHVGKAQSNISLDIPGDDTGDNISNKNPNYCELTAQYWLWKNGEKSKYVGLNHYRRYFDFRRRSSSGYFFDNMKESQVKNGRLDLPKDLDAIFDSYDVILADPMIYPISIEMHYSIAHSKQDLFSLRSVIESIYPDYIDSFDKVMKGNSLSLCNMFIMKEETFNDYSKWLFDILFNLEKQILVSEDPYQSRIYGFMAERLLNVYVVQNKLRPKHYPIIKISEDKPLSQLKGKIKNKLNNLAFSIISKSSDCNVRKV